MYNFSAQTKRECVLFHIKKTNDALKTHDKVHIVTGAIKSYCDLFKRQTGKQLFYKELKRGHFHISLYL